MAGWGHSSTRLFLTSTLIASLIGSLLCVAVRGDDLSTGKSFRLRAVAFAPIGKVFSLGEVSINGRSVYGEQAVWNGDVLRVSEGAATRVAIDSVGTVTLARATAAGLSVALPTLGGEVVSGVLMISLIRGAVSVRLVENVSAYLEVGGSEFAVAKGSAFRVEIRDGRAEVDLESEMFRRYYFVDMSRTDPVKGTRTQIPVPQRIKTETRSQTRYVARSTTSTDGSSSQEATIGSVLRVGRAADSEKRVIQQLGPKLPAAGRVLKFDLGSPSIGALSTATGSGQSVTATTDTQGEAPVTFEAGPGEGSASFTVTDVTVNREPDEKRQPWSGTIVVEKGWWAKHRTKVISGAIAAVAITLIIKPRTGPLKQEPPPQIP